MSTNNAYLFYKYTFVVQGVTQADKKKTIVDTYSSRRPYYLTQMNLIDIPIALKNQGWHICITKKNRQIVFQTHSISLIHESPK